MEALRTSLPIVLAEDTENDARAMEAKVPQRVLDTELFWARLVRAVREQWEKVDVSTVIRTRASPANLLTNFTCFVEVVRSVCKTRSRIA